MDLDTVDISAFDNAVRVLLASVATGTFVILAWANYRIWARYTAAPLLLFLTGVVGAFALLRWVIVWLVFTDPTGWLRTEVAVRTMVNALLVLLFVALSLIALFHLRRMLSGTSP